MPNIEFFFKYGFAIGLEHITTPICLVKVFQEQIWFLSLLLLVIGIIFNNIGRSTFI